MTALVSYYVQLTPTQLAHFATPKTWPEVFMLTPRMTRAEWRAGVIDADERGRGFLWWTPGPSKKFVRQIPGGTWVLTEVGAAFVEAQLGCSTVQ